MKSLTVYQTPKVFKTFGVWSLSLTVAFAGLAACAPAPQPAATPTSTPPAAAATATAAEAPTAVPSPTGTQPAPTLSLDNLTGRIVYSTEGDVYVMNADGTEVTRLTDHPEADFDPVWSPDGSLIAFRTHRGGDEEVYVMNADGTGQRSLSDDPAGDYSPAWSPDGEWIAFMSNRDGNNEIWVIRPDGSDLRQVTDIPGISEYPSWSPDSARIAFTCTFGRRIAGGSGDFEVCVVNADGTGLVQITDEPGRSTQPAWSPDGAKIVFQTDRGGWPTLPDFVPPGYDPGDFGDYELYWMNPDGSGQEMILEHPEASDEFPAWSRDGLLVFTWYGCLTVLDPYGGGSVQISAGNCAGLDSGQFPDWFQPDP